MFETPPTYLLVSWCNLLETAVFSQFWWINNSLRILPRKPSMNFPEEMRQRFMKSWSIAAWSHFNLVYDVFVERVPQQWATSPIVYVSNCYFIAMWLCCRVVVDHKSINFMRHFHWFDVSVIYLPLTLSVSYTLHYFNLL